MKHNNTIQDTPSSYHYESMIDYYKKGETVQKKFLKFCQNILYNYYLYSISTCVSM